MLQPSRNNQTHSLQLHIAKLFYLTCMQYTDTLKQILHKSDYLPNPISLRLHYQPSESSKRTKHSDKLAPQHLVPTNTRYASSTILHTPTIASD